jgi:hypothetical protein
MVVAGISMALVAFAGILGLAVKAQAQEMQQHLAELKQLLAFNKQAMANYTWLEQQIISVKGEQKKEEIYNVQLGPDGKPQKTPIDPGSVSDSERKRRGLRGRIVEKKTEEYEEYGNSIKTLIQQYLPPDKDMLQLSYQAGNVMIGPMGGQPNEYRVVVTNYLKQGDNLTIVMDKSTMALVSVSVATYLTDTSDAVNVNVQFAKMPNGGPFHVSTETINGVSKQLTIVIENSNYAQK